MLIITFHNDATGDAAVANYDAEILITTSPETYERIAIFRIAGHHRAKGWIGLLKRLVEQAEAAELLERYGTPKADAVQVARELAEHLTQKRAPLTRPKADGDGR
jgi:hypothetical protein